MKVESKDILRLMLDALREHPEYVGEQIWKELDRRIKEFKDAGNTK